MDSVKAVTGLNPSRERLLVHEHQKQLSKEFVREWLIANGFMGKEGQVVPHMSDEWIKTISDRYIELYEHVTGMQFVPVSNSAAEIEHNILKGLTAI